MLQGPWVGLAVLLEAVSHLQNRHSLISQILQQSFFPSFRATQPPFLAIFVPFSTLPPTYGVWPATIAKQALTNTQWSNDGEEDGARRMLRQPGTSPARPRSSASPRYEVCISEGRA